MSDFKSLLSVFKDATGTTAADPPRKKVPVAAVSNNNVNFDTKGDNPKDDVDLKSTNDPNFSASLMKQRIERILSIQQIRKSTNGSSNKLDDDTSANASSFHLAICATIVDDFPHEELWNKWMTPTEIDIPHPNNNNDNNINATKHTTKTIHCSAELYIHAKHQAQIMNNSSRSTFFKSKLLPFSHEPNWNDVRVIRAMLSLLQRALQDSRTTHVLFCTESCIPIVTLGEAARSILFDEICEWEEMEKNDAAASNISTDGKNEEGNYSHDQSTSQQKQSQHLPNWNRSYIQCYNQNSPQCTRFDEHNCWAALSTSIPPSSIHKALPGWCLLSRKHAQMIYDLPNKHLDGMNLWPAFERVWAPEEVYFPTALALCGCMEDHDEVLRRSVTHSEWDTRASNHKDRAHPLTYDDNFDYELVRRVRKNGALFMRKLKKELDWNVWEEIVIRHEKGQIRNRGDSRAASSGYDNYRGQSDYRERNSDRYHHDSRQNRYYDNRYNSNRHDRDMDRRRSYDRGHSTKRQRWR